MGASITPPDLNGLLAPILPALPTATASTEPAAGILPLLSPILRQRVKLFSAGSTEPWLRLLSYDTAKAAQLTELVQNGSLEPHPVSGEVEVDWDYDVETRYKRLDQETLQALTVLVSIGLAFQLVYCVNDAEGGSDGWRVGEVTAADKAAPFAQFGGVATIAEAEAKFRQPRISEQPSAASPNGSSTSGSDHMEEEDDDDDGYWDRYDATPARTPAVNRSPAPQASASSSATWSAYDASAAMNDDDDDDYYAQYDSVQPAMDNHDPDEEAMVRAHIQPPLGLGRSNEAVVVTDTNNNIHSNQSQDDEMLSARKLALLHPRPRSSASASSSSNGSVTVAKLEASAVKQEKNDFGIKQHVSRSIRSLFLLARSSGIERDEFEQLVKREMDVLSLMEDEE
ncbi:hypothetical protein ACQKWADRAFT_284925 [Trichoderma austrokoningii]